MSTSLLPRIDSFLKPVIRRVLPSLLCFNAVVFLEPDSLVFRAHDRITEKWYVGEKMDHTAAGLRRITTHAVVSADSTRFLYFREIYFPEQESIFSELTLRRADGKKIWQRTAPRGRTHARYFTEFIDDMIIIVTTDGYGSMPLIELVTRTMVDTIIQEGDWYRLSACAFSPNRRFLLMHVKNPHNEKVWDYIYFIDRTTGSTWSYLFPLCVSCKRYKQIDISVDDDGVSEVVYKNEHRIFSREGILSDVFIKF